MVGSVAFGLLMRQNVMVRNMWNPVAQPWKLGFDKREGKGSGS